MDNMLEHPWTELQLLIKEKWLTQKAFASILWKKVSEVNELLKWKRNITIQWDYLLHETLWTPVKYWILKQVDYDYSLISPSFWTEGEKSRKTSHLSSWAIAKDLRWDTSKPNTKDSSVTSLPQNDNNNITLSVSEVYSANWESTTHQTSHSEDLAEEFTVQQTRHSEHSEESINNNMSSWALAKDLRWEANESSPQDSSSLLSSEWQKTEDEDLKNRAKIFRSF